MPSGLPRLLAPSPREDPHGDVLPLQAVTQLAALRASLPG